MNTKLAVLGIVAVIIIGGGAYWYWNNSPISSDTSVTDMHPVTGTTVVMNLPATVLGHGIVMAANDTSIPQEVRAYNTYNGKQNGLIFKLQDVSASVLSAELLAGNEQFSQNRSAITMAALTGSTIFVSCSAYTSYTTEPPAKPRSFGGVDITNPAAQVGKVFEVPASHRGDLTGGECNPFSIVAREADGTEVVVDEGAYD
jgi:hypothetical protein